MRRCAVCNTKYQPVRSTLDALCSPACALEFVRTRPERLERLRKRAVAKEKREYRERTETPAQARAVAQKAFNKWVRARDSGLPCISCGHPDDGSRKRNAGHYRPAGSNPALRFDPANVHGQCERCNSYLSGNLADYRVGLIARVGLAEVERLEGPHPLPRRTVADYRAIADEYRRRFREITRRGA